ncbi:tyrosyl-tRNA synthetase-like protein [Dendryphion nanum]|uniref:Tyrosine--tRNA ligase n=1 Tax=Dendryphion nanum TaxID=256645 RepID=A0A9P9DX79_9PLEO|nr:tyrosyl-tRNA synthetase-like protein [Dendryphion nanum]
MATAALLKRIPRLRVYICRECVQIHRYSLHGRQNSTWSRAESSELWAEKAREIKSGAQKSMFAILAERGFVKDVAGGSEALDWLLTEKPIGAYVGVDPTAPSLHVGHLLPLMALYWMYLNGFSAVTLLGGGTVSIGDPSGRSTGRKRQDDNTHSLNTFGIKQQLEQLWSNVGALGIKHRFSEYPDSQGRLLNNSSWLQKLNAVTLMKDLGSGMRLGSMLSRDSVKLRMRSGDGMAMSEFSYPLFQAYDWWYMYSKHGIQMQIGGSDQYGNICAGMDAISHMQSISSEIGTVPSRNDPRNNVFGLSTPLMTTSTGEKFGKSAGNAVWLDRDMLSSFDLYQYFLGTADADVERYLKLFTFLPMDSIYFALEGHAEDPSKRLAQHLLAKEVVELAHGAVPASQAERAHKEAFSHGTHLFSLGALRSAIHGESRNQVLQQKQRVTPRVQMLLEHKKEFLASSVSSKPTNVGDADIPKIRKVGDVLRLPITFLQEGSFPQLFYAAGLASSKSDAHRLIKGQGAYVVVPNSGTPANPHGLQWTAVPSLAGTDPNHYLIDWEAIVLRVGKTKIQVCQLMQEDEFEAEGLTFPGWEEFKAKRAEAQAAA